jgi:uncharacterized protein (TIGR03435 family)
MRCQVVLISGVLLGFPCHGQRGERVEFEAASVKLSPLTKVGASSMYCRGGPGSPDPGLFVCENSGLPNLILWAYGPLTPDQLSAPERTMTEIYNVSAKVPRGATHEQFQTMLRNLLADRFKLAVHYETKSGPGYGLVVAKNGTKFRAATAPVSNNQSSHDDQRPRESQPLNQEGYPVFADGEFGSKTTGTPSGTRAHMYVPRMTMADLASSLSAQLHAKVEDATGLKGEYEINLFWTDVNLSPPSSDSSQIGPTLMRAVQSQLGLRLESRKVLTDILVVDHAEKVPTEN